MNTREYLDHYPWLCPKRECRAGRDRVRSRYSLNAEQEALAAAGKHRGCLRCGTPLVYKPRENEVQEGERDG